MHCLGAPVSCRFAKTPGFETPAQEHKPLSYDMIVPLPATVEKNTKPSTAIACTLTNLERIGRPGTPPLSIR